MRKLFKFLFILFLGVLCCACVNRAAVQELNEQAYKLIKEGDYEGCISRLEASVELDGEIYESRYNLANAYLTLRRYDEALVQIEEALKLKPNEPAVYYTHGVIATKLADNLMVKRTKQGLIPVEFNSSAEKIAADERYVELLKKANKSFDKYTEILPNADDTQNVIRTMKNNEKKILEKSM